MASFLHVPNPKTATSAKKKELFSNLEWGCSLSSESDLGEIFSTCDEMQGIAMNDLLLHHLSR